MFSQIQRRISFRFGMTCLLVAAAAAGGAPPLKSGKNRAVFPADFASTAAYRVAQLDRRACLAELARRNIPFQTVADAPGVRAPVRLQGAIRGIRFFTGLAEAERQRVPWEVLDCRLVLALDAWAEVLIAHDVSDVVFSSGWRPAAKIDGNEGKRHEGGLALDVHVLRLKSGGELVVERDFHGRLDAPVCGPDSAEGNPSTPETRQLRSLVCSSAEMRIFQSILTPNYDVHHANHLHMEVTPNVRWFILS